MQAQFEEVLARAETAPPISPRILRTAVTLSPATLVRSAFARGMMPMAWASLACSAAVLACAAPLYHHFGLSFEWETLFPNVVLLTLLFGVWSHHQLVPDRRQSATVNDLILVVFLLLLLTNVSSPAQYVAVALKRPLVDHWLAAADAALGIHVPSMTAWTRAHPRVGLLLTLCYYSLLPQFVLAPIVAGLVLRDRKRLWEYLFHFHLCLLVTLACLALFPAAHAFTYYGFESTLNQERLIHQFKSLRDGSFTSIRFDDLEGLISMPSFHALGAAMITWMFRGYRRWLLPVALLNAGLVAATVLTGAHYFIDVVGSGVVFLMSLIAFRFYGSLLMPQVCPRSGFDSPEENDADKRVR